jgi:signal peptidase I
MNRRTFLILLVVLPVLAVLGRSMIATRMKVDGNSMLPTYKLGERFTTYHLAYWWRMPKCGEVVTCRSPRRPEVTVLKRIIGLPGDEIHLSEGIVYVNGTAIPKTECPSDVPGERIFTETLDGTTWRTLESGRTLENVAWANWSPDGVPYKVPTGMVFVLGDHRDNSTDSRVFGDVPMGFVTGKVKQ